METKEAKELKKGNEVFYANSFWKVLEIKPWLGGVQIGVYDETDGGTVYLSPEYVWGVMPCPTCTSGCPLCGFSSRYLPNNPPRAHLNFFHMPEIVQMLIEARSLLDEVSGSQEYIYYLSGRIDDVLKKADVSWKQTKC